MWAAGIVLLHMVLDAPALLAALEWFKPEFLRFLSPFVAVEQVSSCALCFFLLRAFHCRSCLQHACVGRVIFRVRACVRARARARVCVCVC